MDSTLDDSTPDGLTLDDSALGNSAAVDSVFGESQFDNSFVRDLPGDPEADNFRRQVEGACYSRVEPTPVAAPKMLAYSPEMAAVLGLSNRDMESQAMADVLGGNGVVKGMDPYAACYGGHQFGHWAGQLGDGRAISLGETLTETGRWELQLKGAGPTPYSRGADGRAVVRSSVRELLCSEAMHHLGVPTTRALSLVSTGDAVVRDMFYDGRAAPEPGAVVCRVSPSFLRFGNYQLFASRDDAKTLKTLLDYTLRVHFPELTGSGDAGSRAATSKGPASEGPASKGPGRDSYLAWLAEVCRRTAIMVAHWQRVGFVHGVMNTDNMSILGLTIDYGPYGWIDVHDPDWTPNTTDAEGRRYRFGYQPQIAMWNLARLAEAIHPLIGEVEPLEEALEVYSETFNETSKTLTAQKLGIHELSEQDQELVQDLQGVLTLVETDMTIFYRRLADVPAMAVEPEKLSDEALVSPLMDAYYSTEPMKADELGRIADWLRRYVRRAQEDDRSDSDRREAMNRVNPKYVMRNYLAQLAIDKAEQGDGSRVDELLEVMRHPYDEQPEYETYAVKRPEWARHRPGCSMLSCSS